MTPLLVLALVATCLAQTNQNSGTDLTKTGNGNDPNDPNNKFFQLPFLTAPQSDSLWAGGLGAGAALLGQQVFNGVLGGGGGRGSNSCRYPCYPCGNGRKKRQTNEANEVDTEEKPDKKFLGNLFGNGGGNTCCCPQNNYPQNNYPQNNYPQNNYPQNNYPQNNYPQNNYPQNQYPQNQNQRVCQCSSNSKTDRYGNQEARCANPDHTGRRWCYSTTNSNCADAQSSSKYPRNPWSYMACGNNGR